MLYSSKRCLPVWLLAMWVSVMLSLAQQEQQQQSGQLPLSQPPALNQQQQQQQQQQATSTQQTPMQTQQELQRQLERARLRQAASQQLDGNLEEIHHGHRPNGQVPSNNKDLWPMVNVDKHENTSKVDVHVPVFFDMTNHNDPDAGRAKLDLSVLQGLVTVSKDKSRDSDGQMSGPVKVTVFGIPVYTSHGTSSKPSGGGGGGGGGGGQVGASLPSRRRDSNEEKAGGGLLSPLESRIESRVESITERFRDNIERTNEKVMRSLSDIMDRLSSMVRRSRPSKEEGPANSNNSNNSNNLMLTNTRYNTIDTSANQTKAKLQ